MSRKRKFGIAALAVLLLLTLVHAAFYASSARRLNAARVRLTPPAVDESSATSPAYAAMFSRIAAINNDPAWNPVLRHEGSPQSYPAEALPPFSEVLAATPLIADIRAVAETGGSMGPLDASKGYAKPLLDMRTLLLADAHAAEAEKDFERVVADVIALMRLGDAAAEVPRGLHQSVRRDLYESAYGAMVDLLPAHSISRAQRRRLLDPLANGQHRAAAVATVAADAHARGDLFRNFTSEEVASEIYRGHNLALGILVQGYVRIYTSFLGRPLRNLDEAEYFETMAELQQLSAGPYYQNVLKLQDLEARLEELPRYCVMTRVMMRYEWALERQAYHESKVALAQLGLAIEDYHDEFGSYPVSLEAFADRIAGVSLIDPITGLQYTYQPAAQSFVLGGREARWR